MQSELYLFASLFKRLTVTLQNVWLYTFTNFGLGQDLLDTVVCLFSFSFLPRDAL